MINETGKGAKVSVRAHQQYREVLAR